MRRLRLLHAIHDFLPRHRAGAEIYTYHLARELSARHDVSVVAAEYDPATPHGTLRWNAFGGLALIEIINNWECDGFEESYSSPRLNRQLGHFLDATQPDVLHVHNLLNLSFDLPRLARERGIPVVATLHDYTIVCASGGQRVHTAEAHVCEVIDVERCSRCFAESPFAAQLAVGGVSQRPVAKQVMTLAGAVGRRFPRIVQAAAGHLPQPTVTPADIHRRIAYARHVFEQIDWFVSPSAALAADYIRFGLAASRIEVSDYGFPAVPSVPRRPSSTLRCGFVGTLVWHKGAHVLLKALERVRGPLQAEIYGDFDVFPRYTSELRRMADGLPVRFHGACDRDRIAEAYASFDVLVVPSLWPENSPLVIHEAFMHGAPVIAARIGGIPGLVSDDVNGLLYEPYRPEDLAAVLQRVVDDPSVVPRLASAAPRVKRIEEDAREWEHRYHEVIAGRRRVAEPV